MVMFNFLSQFQRFRSHCQQGGTSELKGRYSSLGVDGYLLASYRRIVQAVLVVDLRLHGERCLRYFLCLCVAHR